jgi:hypothetical protein
VVTESATPQALKGTEAREGAADPRDRRRLPARALKRHARLREARSWATVCDPRCGREHRSAPQGARSSAVRVHPCGRVALAGAGRALMRLRGPPGARERKVVPCWFGTPGKPFRRRPGLPFRTADREPSLAITPLLASRAPSGLAEDRCRSRGPAAPSRASCPFSACGAADSVDAGLPHPPPSVLSVSRALDGLHPATPARACFIPITLMGFHLQGFDPLRGPCPSRGRCSHAVGDTRRSR